MVRPLSHELQKKAIDELHEDPKRVEDDIKHIQEWFKQQPHLNAPTDKQWILSFLRGSKFSLERAKEKLDMYYTAKNLYPELFKPRDVYSLEIQTLLKAGTVLPLPYFKGYQGPRVILFRFNNCDTNIINMENIFAIFFMMTKILMFEDDNLIISGVIFWADMIHYPLSFIFQCHPTFIKNHLHCLQNALPIRIKGIHTTGSPAMAETFFNLFKVYMGAKLKNRMFVHSANGFENIFKSVPKKCMPKEYGGENSNIEEIRSYWIKKMESYSTWFVESNQYTANESQRPEKLISVDNIIGMDGSFRKLNID